jgi:DNA polymerase IV (DinB-like DNA polymerase)
MNFGWVLTGKRVILHLDLDYFFAQCEEREDLSLRGKPVVVCVYSARGGDSGVVSTSNYVARKYGVKAGMPITWAKKKLKKEEAFFIPVRKAFYQQVSDDVMRRLHGYADIFEQVSIDEAFLDVTQRVNGDFSQGEVLAKEIREVIRVGEGLTCSVGVGPNKLVAKIAAGQRKPDGLMIVKPNEVTDFLYPLPIGELPGVGKKTEKKMIEKGIMTIGDLAKYRVEELMNVFGKAIGTYFYKASKGVDETLIQEGKHVKQVSRITTLRVDTRDLKTILVEVNRLCEDVHATIKKKNLCFKSVSVIVVIENLTTRMRSTTLETPTNALNILKTRSQRLLEDLLQEDDVKIRRIGVKASKFVDDVHQKNLTAFIK